MSGDQAGNQEQAKKLSEAATASLGAKDYAGCLARLEELSKIRPNDSKVQNNVLVAKALQGSEFGSKSGLEQLQAAACSEVVEGAAGHSVFLMLNTASILCHVQQHSAALKLLDSLLKLYQAENCFSNQAEEEVFVAASFLSLDTLIHLRRYTAVADVLTVLEAKYEFCFDDREDSTTPEASIDLSHQPCPSSPKSAAHQLYLGYKARLQLLMGDLKEAKRSIRQLLFLDPKHPPAVALKAELEAARNNLRRAGKLVLSHRGSGTSLTEAEALQLLCNTAHIQHREGRHYAAALSYANALDCAAKAGIPAPLQLKSEDATPADSLHNSEWACLYASAVQALLLKQFDSAFSSFQACAQALQGDPLTLLRSAECCIQAASADIPLHSVAQASKEENSDAVLNTFEAGRRLATEALRLYQDQLTMLQSQSTDHATLDASLVFEEGGPDRAESSFREAVRAFERQLYQSGCTEAVCNLAFCSLKLGQQEQALDFAHQILQAERCETKEYVAAKQYAAEALRAMGRPEEAAQQLQDALRRTLEAADTKVSPEISQSQELFTEVDRKAVSAGETGDDQVSVLVNLASTYCSLSEMQQAEAFAAEAARIEDDEEAVLMHVYTLLCSGKTGTALSKLRELHNAPTARWPS